ncbi:lysophospholipid acyltransferase family protein [uncultured Propionibacterium sp.]|uniref:lysophospholipid acyltransferase family protein n=1 Tax=uncultured Propionibacterium sp. TaxID=218066 RepID=UPI002930DC13|nr:lysophospholipid acyltransferase family protein [uncultured Propionibacterium sp.]
MWYRFFKYALFRPGVRLLMHPRLVDEQNIPARGAAVLASNHLDAGDTFTLPAIMERHLIWPAKKELFEGKGLKMRVVAWFLRAVGMVPLDRSGGRASVDTMGPVETELAAGNLIGIFPEGTRTPDGNLYRGHTGAARLALEAGVPIIPVGMVNTRLRRGLLGLPTMRDARIVIGEPLDYTPWRGQADSVRVLRWVTDDVMARIQELSGQEYVDVYASRVKYGNLRGRDLTGFKRARANDGAEVPPTDAELAAGARPTGSGGHDE